MDEIYELQESIPTKEDMDNEYAQSVKDELEEWENQIRELIGDSEALVVMRLIEKAPAASGIKKNDEEKTKKDISVSS